MSKTVLVTGANGFIAHQIIDRIIRTTDYNVIGSVNRSENRLDYIHRRWTDEQKNRFTKFQWNFTKSLLRDDLDGITHVIHLGSMANVALGQKYPRQTFEINVMGTLNVLDHVRNFCDIENFIFFSTNEVFGPGAGSHKETMSPHYPRTVYGASKSAAEQMINSYRHTFNMPISIIRTMNAFGERQQSSRLIPTIMKNILNKEPITIYGEDTTRKMIHTEDIAESTLRILDIPVAFSNVVGANEIRLVNLPEKIGEIMDEKWTVEVREPTRVGYESRYDMDSYNEDNKYYNFDVRLEQTVRWYMDNIRWLYV